MQFDRSFCGSKTAKGFWSRPNNLLTFSEILLNLTVKKRKKIFFKKYNLGKFADLNVSANRTPKPEQVWGKMVTKLDYLWETNSPIFLLQVSGSETDTPFSCNNPPLLF